MKKTLFVSDKELESLITENFGLEANTNVVEVDMDGENILIDVLEIRVHKENYNSIINKLIEKLQITSSEIYEKKDENGDIILMLDFMDLTTLLEEKYNLKLTGQYKACCCDIFDNPVLAFEIK